MVKYIRFFNSIINRIRKIKKGTHGYDCTSLFSYNIPVSIWQGYNA